MDFFYPPELPISRFKDDIADLLKRHQVIIVAGDTGSGKTTQLPKICLETFPALSGLVGCTQPRRVAATSVSERVREELGAQAGLVGCKIRFYDTTTPETCIKFMTDGVLLAETRQDALLRNYDIIIVDEAHERSLNIDFLLGCLHRIIVRRPELKLIITSATIDTATFARHFQEAPVIRIEGRTYPVDIVYRPPPEQNEDATYIEHCLDVVAEICDRHPPGDILVFLPTERDIRTCCDILQGRARHHLVLPMFGRLQAADQKRIFARHQKSKIVVATNVAETSVTVPGIRYVVDSGLARISSYNPRARTTSLPVTRISRASCNQRSGRCGRIGPGVCFRLFSEEDYLDRPEFTIPEIQRSNLAEVILQMVALNLGDPFEFPFLAPPKPSAIRDGYRMLQELGAITETRRLTRYGKIMARLPIDPVIARIIIEAEKQDCLRDITIIAAALAIQDPRVRPADKEQAADAAHQQFAHPHSDFIVLLNIWNAFHTPGSNFSWSRLKRFCSDRFLSFQRMREWIDLHDQLVRLLKDHDDFHFSATPVSYEALHRSLLTGFFRQCARRRRGALYQGAGNREVMIFPGSHQFTRSGEWIIAGSFIETSRLYALTIATIEPDWIEESARAFCSYSWTNPRWQKKTGQVIADETVSLNGLVIIAGRPVNFARRDPKNRAEARSIFIQKGLVEARMHNPSPFLSRNLALISSWQQAEDKLRKKDVVVEDAALYEFYDIRLPAEVYDRPTLNRFLRDHGDRTLVMSEGDILLRTPDETELADFPASLPYGGTDIALAYHFEPGSAADGVTATIPDVLLAGLRPEVFDWLVPGLLREKSAYLLKGLPKRIRKHLIPINDTVERIFDSLVLYRGNFQRELSGAIFKMFRISVHPDDWPASLPDHLCMRFVVCDAAGVELMAGRDLRRLQAEFHSAPGPSLEKLIRPDDQALINRFQDRLFTSWDFADVPDRIPVYAGTGVVAGHLFAALKACPERQGVMVCYVDSHREAVEIGRAGGHYLLQLAFREQVKQLRKHCRVTLSGPSALWFASVVGGSGQAAAALLDFVLRSLFGTGSEPIIDQRRFDETICRIRSQGLLKTGHLIVDQICALLRQRKEIQDQIARFEQRSDAAGGGDPELFRELRLQLDEILPGDFMDTFSIEQAADTVRYLKSLAIRTERAYANPSKDRQKQERIAVHARNLARYRDKMREAPPECRERYDHYQRLVAELRVSLFSPEIKTTIAVSEKKAAAAWKELAATC